MEKQKKKGRPKKPTDEVKGKQIRVRLTDDEKEKLELMAKHYDVSQSELIRILINTYTIKNSKGIIVTIVSSKLADILSKKTIKGEK